MMRPLTLVLLSIVLVTGCSVSATAQYRDTGKLNTWTTAEVSRLNYEVGGLRAVRAARNDGFDRVVFEFADGVPSFSLSYARSLVYDQEKKAPAKISGTVFMELSLVALYEEKNRNAIYEAYPRGELGLPMLREIKVTKFDFYRAEAVFAFGLQARHEFRVQTLTNPARLVVDIKH